MHNEHLYPRETDIVHLLPTPEPTPKAKCSGSWMDNPELLARRRIKALTFGSGIEALPGVWVERHNRFEKTYFVGLFNPQRIRGIEATVKAAVALFQQDQAQP